MPDAEHEETAPQASTLIISKMVCPLAGKSERIKIEPGTLAHRSYGKEEAIEQFRCSYGLNPEYQEAVQRGGLRISGFDPDGKARIVELPDRRFYLATLFLPQLSSVPKKPHPLIVGFMRAALEFKAFQDGSGSAK